MRGWELVGGVGNWYEGLGTSMRGWELVGGVGNW